ncbi:MAG TPA: hypothetical protein VNM90_15255 [Haliangium sp.]|nr:hypothetical protein [Haliangium sp.]
MILREDIVHAARPLRQIFWGTLLVLLDVTFSLTYGGGGFRFDVLDDTLGMVLIIAAVARLRGIPVDSYYVARMGFIRWVAILALSESILDHFIFAQPWLLTFLLQILGIAKIVASLLFLACMRDLCLETMLIEAARRWQTTLTLFLVFYGIPFGLLLIVAMLAGDSFHIDAGPGMLLIVLLFLVPLVSFFGATLTMARSARMPAMGAAAWPYVNAPSVD